MRIQSWGKLSHLNLYKGRVKSTHQKLGKYLRVANHLYQYSVTKKYYAVLKVGGKTKWIPLNTTDREIAGRNLKDEVAKLKNTDPQQSKMTLESLLALYEESIQGLNEAGKIKRGQAIFKLKDPKKALNAACKRLKLANYSSRALRRCFIPRAVELGVDFKTIAGWQGHQAGGVIAKTYSHLRNEHSDNMATKLAA
jgi:integrase